MSFRNVDALLEKQSMPSGFPGEIVEHLIKARGGESFSIPGNNMKLSPKMRKACVRSASASHGLTRGFNILYAGLGNVLKPKRLEGKGCSRARCVAACQGRGIVWGCRHSVWYGHGGGLVFRQQAWRWK